MDKRKLLLTAGSAVKTYQQKVKDLYGSALIAYWPLNEAAGVTALDASGNSRNGTYRNDGGTPPAVVGLTLANVAGPTKIGGYAPAFTAGYVSPYSASLAGAFSGLAGTLAFWLKISDAALWPEEVLRRFCVFNADSSNYLTVEKRNTNPGAIRVIYSAGGTVKTIILTPLDPAGWSHIAVTWDHDADKLILYWNGAAQGSPTTGLGDWVGSIASAPTKIAATDATPSNPWSGAIDDFKVLNRAATAAEILQEYSLGS